MLAPARSLDGGPAAVLEVVRRFGSIQFDPLAVAGRNHDLVLHARVADYDPAWCDLLYERREVFEAFNKGLSLVPMSDVPWFRIPWREGAPRVLAENAEVAEQVLERIRSEGPLSALDFERGPAGDLWGSGDSARTSVARAVLEAYSVTGVLGLARRDGNRRYYDLIERLATWRRARTHACRCASSFGTRCSRATAGMASLVSPAPGTSLAAWARQSRTRRIRSTPDEPRCARSWSRTASSSG